MSGSSSSSSSNLRAPSAQSDDVNITIDSGEPYPGDESSDILGAFGNTGMSGSQHPYLTSLPQLPVSFSPTHPSPLLLHEGPYQATHNQHYSSHVIPSAPLRQNSSSSNATFGSLSLTTSNLHAVEAQPPSAGPHTPAHSAIVSPYGPISPSEVFATPDQLLTPYHQTQSFGVLDTPQAAHALSVLAATHASPHSSNSHSSGSSRAHSNPHSSPNAIPHSPLHQASSSQTQLNIDVLAAALPASAHEVAPHSAVEQQQQTVIVSRLDRLVQDAQSLREYAQTFEFSGQRLDKLEEAIKDLWSEVTVFQGDNQTQAQAYATQLDAHLNTLTHDQTHDQTVFSVPSGSGYNQFLHQVDFAQTAAGQGMHLHASAASATGLHLGASSHGLQPHTA